jgi:hypothetical protein
MSKIPVAPGAPAAKVVGDLVVGVPTICQDCAALPQRCGESGFDTVPWGSPVCSDPQHVQTVQDQLNRC